MISNQILQNTIDGLKNIAHVDLCVLDIDGKEVASTTNEIGNVSAVARDFVESPADSQEIQGHQYFKIYDEQQLEYLGFLGITMDAEANKKRGETFVLSSADSKVKVIVLPTNEELAICRDTVELVTAAK